MASPCRAKRIVKLEVFIHERGRRREVVWRVSARVPLTRSLTRYGIQLLISQRRRRVSEDILVDERVDWLLIELKLSPP
jgi:hypothetical protein